MSEAERQLRALVRRLEKIARNMAQLRIDVDSYNENSGEVPITLITDLSEDVREHLNGLRVK